MQQSSALIASSPSKWTHRPLRRALGAIIVGLLSLVSPNVFLDGRRSLTSESSVYVPGMSLSWIKVVADVSCDSDVFVQYERLESSDMTKCYVRKYRNGKEGTHRTISRTANLFSQELVFLDFGIIWEFSSHCLRCSSLTITAIPRVA